LKKGNNSISASIPTLPGGALKGGGKAISAQTSPFTGCEGNDRDPCVEGHIAIFLWYVSVICSEESGLRGAINFLKYWFQKNFPNQYGILKIRS